MQHFGFHGALLLCGVWLGSPLQAQVTGPEPTYPRPTLPAVAVSDSSHNERSLRLLLESPRPPAIRVAAGVITWPNALRPTIDCASAGSLPATPLSIPDSAVYLVSSEVILNRAGDWATETGALTTSLAPGAPPAGTYLRVWRFLAGHWSVVAVCIRAAAAHPSRSVP